MPAAPRVRIGLYRPAHLPDVSLITSHATDFTAPRHFHDELEISLQHNGVSELTYRGATYVVPQNHFSLSHPGEVHGARSLVATQGLYRGLRIGMPLLNHVSEQVAGRSQPLPFFAAPLHRNPEMKALLLHLHTMLNDADSPLLEQETLVLTTLARLLTQCAVGQNIALPSGPEQQAVERIRDYLETCYAENVSLSQLAAIVGFSPYHLNRVFRAHVGMPPHAYQTQVRVLRAKTLLAQGHSPGGAAFETGFASQSHFGRHFQALVGTTPGQYRRSTQSRKNVIDFAS